MGARGVSEEAVVEAAETVAEKIDVLLERATDAVLGAPWPGSPQWRQEWESRESDSGRAALEQRARVKIAIAVLAGVDPRHEIERACRAGIVAAIDVTGHGHRRPAGARLRTAAAAADQLAIW
ncbi:hypothetical protein ACFYVR_24950 [Rhodococcus sp. NPDC003318]|uniref:hypothetical protein n=1 Tax=Rhodococcus sp. NPDC003318 TaxID=3364503 RepID=UPI0036C52746